MENPWRKLPEAAPFVLVCDQQRICDFNAIAKKEHKIHVEVLPEPYTGNPEAPVLLLNLNPGFYEMGNGNRDSTLLRSSRWAR